MGQPSLVRISYALSCDLTGPAAAAVEFLWDSLEARFGLRSARATERPHITFLTGSCPDPAKRDQWLDRLLLRMARVAALSPPVVIDTDGISSFDSARPVLFLRIPRSEALLGFYNALWQAAEEIDLPVDAHYRPSAWTPHCTLAMGDLEPDRLPDVREFLRTQSLGWRCQLRALDLVRVVEPVHEYVESWPLRKCEPAEPEIRPPSAESPRATAPLCAAHLPAWPASLPLEAN